MALSANARRILRIALSGDDNALMEVEDSLSDPRAALKEITVSLSADQIKSGFSSPIDTKIPLPGAEKAISFEGALIKFTSNSTPFTSEFFTFSTGNATATQAKSASGSEGTILDSDIDAFVRVVPLQRGTTQLVQNELLFITVDSDSAVGDGTAIISITYKIVSL